MKSSLLAIKYRYNLAIGTFSSISRKMENYADIFRSWILSRIGLVLEWVLCFALLSRGVRSKEWCQRWPLELISNGKIEILDIAQEQLRSIVVAIFFEKDLFFAFFINDTSVRKEVFLWTGSLLCWPTKSFDNLCCFHEKCSALIHSVRKKLLKWFFFFTLSILDRWFRLEGLSKKRGLPNAF